MNIVFRIVLPVIVSAAVTFMFLAPIKGFKWRK